MMSDRELLERAAKAAGHEPVMWCGPHGWLCETLDGSPRYYWNPLTSDADALRLAVKLGLCVEPYPFYVPEKHAVIVKQRRRGDMMRESNPTEVIEQHAADPYAATRRAIVRAAAALGGECTDYGDEPTDGRNPNPPECDPRA